MTDWQKRMHRCCFTGHRPEKINIPEELIRNALTEEIRQAIIDGFSVFISGMARGVDILAAETVLQLRNTGEKVKLICACPFMGFEQNWSSNWRERYNKILHEANLVRYICPTYSRVCFQIRNKWMIDHSARVIAVWNGQLGGTKNTITYANAQGVDVINVLEKGRY